MDASVILGSPVLLVGYGLALIFCIYDLVRHATGVIFPIISICLCVATTVLALLMGAGLQEVAIVISIFLALSLTTYHRHKGGDK